MAVSNSVNVGHVGKPHGLDGSFHVYQGLWDALEEGTQVLVGDRTATVQRRAGTPQGPILRLSGFSTREQIDAFRRTPITVPADALPPLAEDEWYAHQLEGCEVTGAGRTLGTVQRLMNYPSCDLIEVKAPDGGEITLIPLLKDALNRVDIEAKQIDVNLDFLGIKPPE